MTTGAPTPRSSLPTPDSPAGRIFDIGYQPYRGPREGRRRALAAIYTTSLKSVFGIGRGGKAKIIPFGLLALTLVPALIALGISTLLGANFSPIRYENYFNQVSVLLTLFCALAGPELLCPDRRNRTLSLYFAHAVTRLDYAAMKGAALVTALFLIAVAPQLLIFIGNSFATDGGWDYVRDNLDVLPRILLAGLVLSLYLGLIALAAASLTPRRIFAAAGYLALMLISSAAAAAIWETFRTEEARAVILLSFGVLPFGATAWIFDAPPEGIVRETDLPGELLFAAVLAYAALALAIIVWRYLRWEP